MTGLTRTSSFNQTYFLLSAVVRVFHFVKELCDTLQFYSEPIPSSNVTTFGNHTKIKESNQTEIMSTSLLLSLYFMW